MARIVFFASIREELGIEQLDMDITDGIRLSQVIETLTQDRGGIWRSVLTAENVRFAVNQEMVNGDLQVSNGDEIAFFPPVTGG